MVETRRSDEPLVETVDPDALVRRGRATTGGGAVPERGRKATRERSPETNPRNSSYFEEMLGNNVTSYWMLIAVRAAAAMRCAVVAGRGCAADASRRRAQGIITSALLVAIFTPVPSESFVAVAAVWAWAGLSTALRFPRKPRVEQPGPYPFRPVAAPPVRGFADQHQARARAQQHATTAGQRARALQLGEPAAAHGGATERTGQRTRRACTRHSHRPATRAQMLSLVTGVITPVMLIMASRFWHIKFASDELRSAVASQLFLQLCQYASEALGMWPVRLAPPVWLALPALFGAARMRALLAWFAASRADALFPRVANRFGFHGLKWLFRRHKAAELMLTATRMASLGAIAATLVDTLVALPLVEVPAFMDARHVHHKPALHAGLEPCAGREGTKTD